MWTRRAMVFALSLPVAAAALPVQASGAWRQGAGDIDPAGETAPQITYRAAITVKAADSIDRFRRLLAALEAQVPGTRIEVIETSLPLALKQLRDGSVDLILPFAAPASGQTAPARLAPTPIMKGYQILYTNRAKPLDRDKLGAYRIEVDPSMAATFPFPVLPSAGTDESFARLHAGTIDGYINAEGVADAALKRLGFRSIHRYLYRTIDGFALIGEGPRANDVAAFLEQAASRATAHPDFKMMQERVYGEWQP